ncbi:ATP-binding protein [Hydrogenophaga sp. T2]|uniref:ATP-binding protein n=1 Tax=Hydrogenophaga sp. T2 TaxID=3132823 RepID=UPI003CF3464E
MKRYLDNHVIADLNRKIVVLTGPRQVGKTTLARQLMASQPGAQYLNWDVPADRGVLERQSWNPKAPLLVLDEIHKMPGWKQRLKGIADGRAAGQRILVTGSARMDTFRQSGESLAGRYLAWRLHPISVREWCEQQGAEPEAALSHLLERGGFPEPALAPNATEAARWRQQYFTDLIREDIVDFSRVQEIGTMKLFVELLRERVGSPLSLASIARDLAVSPTTLKRYLDILQALFVVFTVTPWHHNIARSLLQSPKVYFFDTGVVRGDDGVRFENAVAGMLLKHAQYEQDAHGKPVQLHYLRTKDGTEVDFALAEEQRLTHLIECKWADAAPHRALRRFADQFPNAEAVQIVRQLRQPEWRDGLHIAEAAPWLAQLSA